MVAEIDGPFGFQDIHGGCEHHGECDFGDDGDEMGDDDRAGELLCFLMDLQATAMESFGGGSHGTEFDPKLYVDLPLKGDLDVTMAAFRGLPRALVTGSVSPGIHFRHQDTWVDQSVLPAGILSSSGWVDGSVDSIFFPGLSYFKRFRDEFVNRGDRSVD